MNARMKALLVISVLAAVYNIVGALEYADALDADTMRKERLAELHTMGRYTSVITACLNGESLRVDDQVVVDCKRRKQ